MLKFLLIVYAVLFVFGMIHTVGIIKNYMENGGYEKCYNPLRKMAFWAGVCVATLVSPFVYIGVAIYCVIKKVNSFI